MANYHNGYDLFVAQPKSDVSFNCRICGMPCKLEEGATTPHGWVHNRFTCPNGNGISNGGWHEKAYQMLVEAEKTTSPSIRRIILSDIEGLLRGQGILFDPGRRLNDAKKENS